MLSRFILAFSVVLISSSAPTDVHAHCQVPCGIYDDQARISQMLEDTETIRKAIDQMSELATKGDVQSMNQLTRWIMTKEEHASRIIETVSEYFLTQKVKSVAADEAGYDEYLRKLADHHAVMRAAMQAKQKSDAAAAASLHEAIDKLARHYGN